MEPAERGFIIKDYPVQVGMIFPRGELTTSPGGCVKDDLGNKIPFLSEVTGWWDANHTSIKWLLLKFKVSTNRRYYFVPGETPLSPTGNLLASQNIDQSITINTGCLVAILKQGTGNLFDSVLLNGRQMLVNTAQPAMVLVKDVAGVSTPTTLNNWNVIIEENTPLQTTLKATGDMKEASGATIASIEIRYQFFKDESFVRIYHTMVWKVREPKEDFGSKEVKQPQVGLNQWSLRLTPALGVNGNLEVGKSDYTADRYTNAWDAASNYYIHQEEEYEDPNPSIYPAPQYVTRYSIKRNDAQVDQGQFLGGYISMKAVDGYGIGVAIRDLWQMYPKAFKVQDKSLSVEFWPSQGHRMGFAQADILTPELYWNKTWENENGYAGQHWRDVHNRQGLAHFIDEFGPNWFNNPYYYYTAEGASRTHELTINFIAPNPTRQMNELNSITQHPVILRQDPKEAMRVPFMGFTIKPVDKENFPEIEWSIDQLGKISLFRLLAKKGYGLWRFGFQINDWLDVNYRWMGGLQYDMQLIPWLLFMRGGDRSYYEEAERTTRYAMDVHTNHFTTRGGYSPGYMSGSSGMPFPWIPLHNGKSHKIHYLSYSYHLTGYQRAKNIMNEIIQNTVAENPAPSGGRELYNMNTFWANAYEETFDPKIADFCRNFFTKSIAKEYNPTMKVFRSPDVYLYNALVWQYSLWPNDSAKNVMLENLTADGFRDYEDGGVYNALHTIGCQWAYEQTRDSGFIQSAWDVSRNMADLVPNYDWKSDRIPGVLSGLTIYEQYLMPILVGYSLAADHSYVFASGHQKHDVFWYLYNKDKTDISQTGKVYIRPRHNGDLSLRIIGIGIKYASLSDFTVRVYQGSTLLSTITVPSYTKPPINDSDYSNQETFRFWPRDYHYGQRQDFVLPNAQQNTVYKLEIETINTSNINPLFLLLAPKAGADIVYEPYNYRDSAAPLNYLYFTQLAGQYSAGVRVFNKTTQDDVLVSNVHGKPFTIHDADTGELLYRYNQGKDPTDFMNFKISLGKNRNVMFTFYGYVDMRGFIGFSPYFSAAKDSWFDPTQPPELLFGDLSGDAKVTAYDAALATKIAARGNPTADELKRADVNRDGKIDGIDVVLIGRRAVGL